MCLCCVIWRLHPGKLYSTYTDFAWLIFNDAFTHFCWICSRCEQYGDDERSVHVCVYFTGTGDTLPSIFLTVVQCEYNWIYWLYILTWSNGASSWPTWALIIFVHLFSPPFVCVWGLSIKMESRKHQSYQNWVENGSFECSTICRLGRFSKGLRVPIPYFFHWFRLTDKNTNPDRITISHGNLGQGNSLVHLVNRQKR